MHRSLSLALSLTLLTLACGDDASSQPDAGTEADAAAPPDADTGEVPRIEAAACRYPVPAELGLSEGDDYTCGDLVVLEDRAELDGRRLRLHFVRFAGAAAEAEVATIYLDGGPGGDGSNMLRFLALDPELLGSLRGQGDFLVLSQRGTRRSEPYLACNAGPAVCAADLSRDSDLAHFHTAANADDVDELRAALGYDQLNLYGISYGSRLALEVLRRHGGSVRAAVAGGTVPAQVVWPAEIPTSFHGALTALASSCNGDGGCAAAYGDLETAFVDGLAALGDQPAVFDYRGTDVDIYAPTYASLLFQLLYSRSAYPILPLLITDLRDRRTDRLSDFLTQVFDTYLEDRGIAAGMYYSVVCNELFNPPDPGAFDAANADVPAAIRDAFSYNWPALLQACEVWPVGAPQPALTEAVSSDVPTLLPNGRLDPITPPRFGELAAETLTAGTAVSFANSGHGATLQSPCGRSVLLAFLAAPPEPVDAGCAEEVDVEFFLPGAATGATVPAERLRAELERAPLPPLPLPR